LILVVSVVSLFVFTLFLPKIYLILTILSIALAAMLYTQLYLKKYQNALTYVLICTGAAIVFVFSVDYLVNKVLKPYQRQRIMVLINPEDSDKLSAGWNVSQSKIAIGSGGFWGKGFLAGTQTKLNFVPEQSTDFIFSTIGEEYGWMGSLATVGLFILILYRIIFVAERQRDRFVRIYAYGVASILFFHFAINIAMTIGLFPVVGIPLPFISYGGSSLIGFTVLLFILVKLDSHRAQMMERK
jgi:rod shape determining protein RodA